MTIHNPADAELLRSMSALALAHVGDGVYELLVRDRLARRGVLTGGQLHKKTVANVSAVAQSEAARVILPVLTEEETAVYHRGRNARVHGIPAGATVAQYHAATALETLFGWLWLAGRTERAAELFAMISEAHDAA